MRVADVTLRDFRGYDRAHAQLGRGLTVVTGPNGAGKTNLLEAVYFGCTGRSCRTSNDRELVRFGASATRVTVRAEATEGSHELVVAYAPGQIKQMTVDGVSVERLLDSAHRPLVSVFLPDRLELVKGVPAGRRAHLDQFVAALWPSRSVTRRAYAQVLAQRNALLGRIRDGLSAQESLNAWDAQLASHALALMADRREAVGLVADDFATIAARLGLDGDPSLDYRPRSRAEDVSGFVAELAERHAGDVERGYTGHGPHRDDLVLKRQDRELKTYGSQGQQRLGLLALLLAERQVLAERRQSAPLMLLDDVMSELDSSRRRALVELLEQTEGQALITATDPEHVPGSGAPGMVRITVAANRLAVEPAGVAH